MKRIWFWASFFPLCLIATPANSQSRNELKLGADGGVVGGTAGVPLTLSTTDEVQGLVSAFDWPAAAGLGIDLVPGPALAGADTVVRRVEADYMVLGVVMDSNPDDPGSPEIIHAGDDLLIATAQIRCAAILPVAVVQFVDGKYKTDNGSPVVDNIVVVGGLSIARTEGLVLTNGSFSCETPATRFYFAPGAMNMDGPCGEAKVLMNNSSAVEGYVVAVCHDPAALDLTGIEVGAAAVAQAADFSAADVFPNGGTLGVVVDLVAPLSNNTIPPGEGNHIATYKYCCESPPTRCGDVTTTPLTFCDNVLGNPLKENSIVVGGESVKPLLENGTFTCKSTGVPENCTDGIDNDCDGLIDNADDLDCASGTRPQMFACGARSQDASGLPGPIQGSIGTAVEVCFFYKSPEDNSPGHEQPDHIQGFSMALTFCCDVVAREAIDITGTIVEAVGADFVSVQADNSPADGDGCELIIGVLVDALPPFDGATLPPTETFARVGCVTFDIKDDPTLCDKCCDLKFTDGINGRGKVPIKNLISVENVSLRPQTMDCKVCIVNKERFHRGDCNFSNMGMMAVDIADAASVISFLFLPGTWKFNPPCLDACDCNDDGRVDLADAICILQYLFQMGRFPPPPGPGFRLNDNPNPNMVEETPPGEDSTDDKLTCTAGNNC